MAQAPNHPSTSFRDKQRAASQSRSHLVKDGGQTMPSQFAAKPTLTNTGVSTALRATNHQQIRQQESHALQAQRKLEREQKVSLGTQLSTIQALSPPPAEKSNSETKPSSTTPAFSIVKKTSIHYYDYLIRANGEIVKKSNSLALDRYYLEVSRKIINNGKTIARQYKLIATLPVNEYGLVNFPATNSNLGYDRYGGIQKSGKQTGTSKKGKFTEFVGEGDHYLKPTVAAALFGVLNDMCKLGLKISLGDMSTSNGSDPGDKSGHHGGHGHMGKRTGLDIDFRYIGKDGASFRGEIADGTNRFNKAFNQEVYDSAYKYGFDKGDKHHKANTYQGLSGTLKGVRKMSGHNNHGHLGFADNPVNVMEYEPYHSK